MDCAKFLLLIHVYEIREYTNGVPVYPSIELPANGLTVSKELYSSRFNKNSFKNTFKQLHVEAKAAAFSICLNEASSCPVVIEFQKLWNNVFLRGSQFGLVYCDPCDFDVPVDTKTNKRVLKLRTVDNKDSYFNQSKICLFETDVQRIVYETRARCLAFELINAFWEENEQNESEEVSTYCRRKLHAFRDIRWNGTAEFMMAPLSICERRLREVYPLIWSNAMDVKCIADGRVSGIKNVFCAGLANASPVYYYSNTGFPNIGCRIDQDYAGEFVLEASVKGRNPVTMKFKESLHFPDMTYILHGMFMEIFKS